MPDRARGMDVPTEVRDAVGDALTPQNLANWWEAKSKFFDGRSPRVVWEDGERERVLDFIEAAKSGDMA